MIETKNEEIDLEVVYSKAKEALAEAQVATAKAEEFLALLCRRLRPSERAGR